VKSADEIKKGIDWDEVDNSLQKVRFDDAGDGDVKKPKTPEEIKKGLEITSNDCLMCACCITDCPYDLECHPGNEETNTNVPKAMLRDALALIQQLEAELRDTKTNHQHTIDIAERQKGQIDKLKKVIVRLNAERDAAVRDCGCFPCQTCEERENGDLCSMCEINGGYRSFHQWRGVQKEE